MKPICRRYPILVQLVYLMALLFLSTSLLANTKLSNSHASSDSLTQIEHLLPQLLDKNFKKKISTVEQLSGIDDPQTIILLESLLESRLFYQKADKNIVIVNKQEQGYEIFNALTNKKIALVEKKTLKKISTNNKLRKTIRTLLAQKKILHPELTIRQAALQEILTSNDSSLLPVLKQAQQEESDTDQSDLLKLAIALIEVDSKDNNTRLSAIKLLGNSLYPSAKGIDAPCFMWIPTNHLS